MRKFLLPTMMAGSLLLGGCAAGVGGGSPLEGILGAVLGGGLGTQGSSGIQEFERAAVNACGDEASRYGRVSISSVDQTGRDTMRVNGVIETNNRSQRQFTCTLRSDGRIVDFRIA